MTRGKGRRAFDFDWIVVAIFGGGTAIAILACWGAFDIAHRIIVGPG